MAEVLGVSAAVFGAVQVASVVVRLLDALRSAQSSKYESIYWTAVAEREISLSWAKRMQLSGTQILPEQEPRVTEIIERLASSYKEVGDALARLYSPKDGVVTPRLLAYRMRFEMGGFEVLEEKLKAVINMNKALNLIAPAPQLDCSLLPAGPQPQHTGYKVIEGGKPSKRDTKTSSVEIQESGIHSPETRFMDTAPEALSWIQNRVNSMDSTVSEEEKDLLQENFTPVSIFSFYTACRSGLSHLVSVPEISPKIRPILARLQTWAVNLFDEVTGLEIILHPKVERNAGLRRFILNSLVNTAIAEDFLLRHFRANVTPHLSQRFDSDRTDLLSLLAKGELLELAVERWKELMEADMDLDESSDEEADDNSPGKEANFAQKTLWRLEDLELTVKGMQAILPAIRSVRKAHRLDLEAAAVEGKLSQEIVVGAIQEKLPLGVTTKPVKEMEVPETQDKLARPAQDAKNGNDESEDAEFSPQVLPTTQESAKVAIAVQTGISLGPVNLRHYRVYVQRVANLAKDLEAALKKDEEFAISHGLADEPVFSVQLGEQRIKLERYLELISRDDSEALVAHQHVAAMTELNNDLQAACQRLLLSFDIFNDKTRLAEKKAADMNETIQSLLGSFNKTTSLLPTTLPIAVAAS